MPRRTEPSQAPDQLESLIAASPMLCKRVRAGPTNHGAQHETENNHIVRVPEDRNEVRHKIDRRRKIDQQHTQPDTHTPRCRWIFRETANQPNNIRHERLRLPEIHPTRTRQREDQHEQKPRRHQRHDHENEDPHPTIVSPRPRPSAAGAPRPQMDTAHVAFANPRHQLASTPGRTPRFPTEMASLRVNPWLYAVIAESVSTSCRSNCEPMTCCTTVARLATSHSARPLTSRVISVVSTSVRCRSCRASSTWSGA